MMEEAMNRRNLLQRNAILILVFTALIAQIVGQYLFRWKTEDGFYSSWVLLRIVFPLLMVWMVGIPFRQLGLGRPGVDAGLWRAFLIIIAGGALIFIGLYFFSGYFDTYSDNFRRNGPDAVARLKRFLIFSSSTIPAWEFLHRSVLLMGIYYILTQREEVQERIAKQVCIALVCAFEVLFHFIKEKSCVEPLTLLIGSPILSYLTLRTGSIWIALILHALVELSFIVLVILS